MPPSTSPQTASVIIADDHPLFRAALSAAVRQVLPTAQILEADSVLALEATVQRVPDADLVLLDLRMPGARGFSSLLWLRQEYPQLPVAVISAEEQPGTMQRALSFGAAGFIPKSSGMEQLAHALRAILDGQTWLPAQAVDALRTPAPDAEDAAKVASLSPQQLRVLAAVAAGQLNKQIAFDLQVTEATIKAHMTAILRKLGLARRTQAALLAQRVLAIEAAALLVDDESEGDS